MHSATKVLSLASAGLAAIALVSCGGGGMSTSPSTGGGSGFVATHLVSNVNTSSNPYSSSNVDPHLVNAWGIAFNPQGFVWVANNGTSTSTLYDGNGVAQSLVVAIPPGNAGSAAPTGIVFNGSSDFQVSQAGVSGASAFLFVGEAGTVSGWSPGVNMTNAIKVVDGAAQGKVYKGLAIASVAGSSRLYAADFHNGVVDMFDASFAPVVNAGGRSTIPPCRPAMRRSASRRSATRSTSPSRSRMPPRTTRSSAPVSAPSTCSIPPAPW